MVPMVPTPIGHARLRASTASKSALAKAKHRRHIGIAGNCWKIRVRTTRITAIFEIH